MKRIIYLLGIISLFVTKIQTVEASHYMGVDITYECNPGGNNPCAYRIHHKTYFDCSTYSSGNPAPSISFNPTSATSSFCYSYPTDISGWVFVSTGEVTPICPTTSTKCTWSSATINGVREVYYYDDYDFCSVGAGCVFNITWYNCCRNYSITSGAGGNGIYTGSTEIDPGLTPCNNSPIFNNKPVPYLCLNQNYTFNQGAFDPDGDSLSYAIITCFQNTSSIVTYNSGYSATSPLGPSCALSIDPVTGDITMYPTTIEIGVMCVEVTEWRNGIEIGTVVRDMQITVINCGANDLPVCQGIDGTGNFQATICANQTICFTLPTVDADSASQNMKFYWNQTISNMTFTDPSATQIDTLTGINPVASVCWTPTMADLGSNFFLITLQDDNCPLIGMNQYTIEIIVEDTASAACSVLPVVLLSFEVLKENSGVKVKWISESEPDISKYCIEKSTDDGKSFSIFSYEPAKTGISALKSYEMVDLNPINGKNIYRLSSITSSGIKKVLRVGEVDYSVSSKLVIYPQPVKKGGTLFLELENPLVETTEFSILDPIGKCIKTWKESDLNVTIYQIEHLNLDAGIYFLKTRSESYEKSIKFQVFQ